MVIEVHFGMSETVLK